MFIEETKCSTQYVKYLSLKNKLTIKNITNIMIFTCKCGLKSIVEKYFIFYFQPLVLRNGDYGFICLFPKWGNHFVEFFKIILLTKMAVLSLAWNFFIEFSILWRNFTKYKKFRLIDSFFVAIEKIVLKIPPTKNGGQYFLILYFNEYRTYSFGSKIEKSGYVEQEMNTTILIGALFIYLFRLKPC